MESTEPPGAYPESRKRDDAAHDIAVAGSGAVPFVGGLIGELIDSVWKSSLERRQLDWHQDVNTCLEGLVGKVDGLEERLKREGFLSLYLEASVAALRTHEEDTREQLRNAVANAALGVEPEDWQFIFVSILSELRPAHVQLLTYLDEPTVFLDEAVIKQTERSPMTNVKHVAKEVFTDWGNEYFDEVARQLSNLGLIQNLGGSMSGRGVLARRTTDLGHRFLRFVADPDLANAEGAG